MQDPNAVPETAIRTQHTPRRGRPANPPMGTRIPQWQRDRFAVLLYTCNGLPLTAAERRTLLWLAGWEPEIVETVAGLIRRAKAVTR